MVEILIVLVIISILASTAIPFYLKYVRVSKLNQSALPFAKACLDEIVAFCMNHPNENIPHTFANCQNRTTLYGDLTFEIDNGICDNGGKVPENFSVKVYSTVTNEYYVQCVYKNQGILCTVEQQ